MRAGRLVTATDSGGLASWKYLFDAEGRRMAKIDLGLGQASTRTSYSGNWEVTNESDFQGTPLREWVPRRWHRRALGADRLHPSPALIQKLYWYHSSDMGHVGALTDEQGSVVELVRYGALGEAQILAPDGVTERTSSVIGNPYLFQGTLVGPRNLHLPQPPSPIRSRVWRIPEPRPRGTLAAWSGEWVLGLWERSLEPKGSLGVESGG